MTTPIPVTDARERVVTLTRPPGRIVSLVPSTTETLHDLGLADAVVGRTRFCVRPRPWVDGVEQVGGTKGVRRDAVEALAPDLIVANLEENRAEDVEALEAIAPVYVAYPRTVDEALDDLTRLAAMTGRAERGAALRAEIEAGRRAARERAEAWTYAYLIWREPWMSLSDDTFIASMLAELGGRGVFGARPERYPTVTLDELVAADPDVVLFSSEPYEFELDQAAELGPLAARVRPIDGEAASWHGTRMREAFAQLVEARESWGLSPRAS